MVLNKYQQKMIPLVLGLGTRKNVQIGCTLDTYLQEQNRSKENLRLAQEKRDRKNANRAKTL